MPDFQRLDVIKSWLPEEVCQTTKRGNMAYRLNFILKRFPSIDLFVKICLLTWSLVQSNIRHHGIIFMQQIDVSLCRYFNISDCSLFIFTDFCHIKINQRFQAWGRGKDCTSLLVPWRAKPSSCVRVSVCVFVCVCMNVYGCTFVTSMGKHGKNYKQTVGVWRWYTEC